MKYAQVKECLHDRFLSMFNNHKKLSWQECLYASIFLHLITFLQYSLLLEVFVRLNVYPREELCVAVAFTCSILILAGVLKYVREKFNYLPVKGKEGKYYVTKYRNYSKYQGRFKYPRKNTAYRRSR